MERKHAGRGIAATSSSWCRDCRLDRRLPHEGGNRGVRIFRISGTEVFVASSYQGLCPAAVTDESRGYGTHGHNHQEHERTARVALCLCVGARSEQKHPGNEKKSSSKPHPL